jgi:hypothetical protein
METKYIVNNLSGQTIDGNLTISGDFTVSGTTNIRPYGVYTALLTQSGVDNPQAITGGNLTIGVTYYIDGNSGGADFTNVGAPINTVGTYFVATGISPNSWGVDGQLTYNLAAPTAIVLENTIGNIWFEILNNGFYSVNYENNWDFNKLWYGMPGVGYVGEYVGGIDPGNVKISIEPFPGGLEKLCITTYNNDFSGAYNGQLNNTPIEIRLYN